MYLDVMRSIHRLTGFVESQPVSNFDLEVYGSHSCDHELTVLPPIPVTATMALHTA